MSLKYLPGSVSSQEYTNGLMLPARWPLKLSRSAISALHSGDDRLVPPIANQPGTGWPPLNVAQSL